MTKIFAQIKPNSRHQESVELKGDHYEIRVKEPAKEDRANTRAIELLAKHFKLPKTAIKLVKGRACRYKTFEISG